MISIRNVKAKDREREEIIKPDNSGSTTNSYVHSSR